MGPVGIGLDGVLSWIPGVGIAYSAVAAFLLMAQGVRARASTATLMQMGALLVVDTLLDGTGGPISGVLDTLFTGHKWSANLLNKHMDDTIYIEGSREDVKDRPEYASLMARIRDGKEKRRIVFLG